MIIVAVGITNAIVLHLTVPENLAFAPQAPQKPPKHIRAAAAVSLTAWLAALTLGRLIGYF